jgi:AraC-like DNA-binding protein
VEVVAYLPPALLTHLRVVVARSHTLTAASTWAEVDEQVRRKCVDVAVTDLQMDGRSTTAELKSLRTRFPALPVVVYTTLSPSTLQGMVELARYGVEHVVLHRFDDDPRRFLELLERLPGYALSDRLLELLAQPLSRVSVEVARAVEWLYRTPSRFHDTPDLAAAAGMTVRTLYRQLESAGFASPKTLVQGARLLRAYSYLQEPGNQLQGVAEKLGYSEPRVLSRQMQAAIGLRPTELRNRIEPEAFVGLLAARLMVMRREVEVGKAPSRATGRDDAAGGQALEE